MSTKKTVSFSKGVTNVFFHILTRCNLKCIHCYINPAAHGKDDIPIETINLWLGAFIKEKNSPNLILLGGEPTLHPHLPQAVGKAKELGYGSITIDTNGYLFNDVLLKIKPDDIDYFSFSLDGATRATNDALRGRGSFDQCIKGITKSVKAGFSAALIYTVSRLNMDELDRMTDLIRDLGIERFFIQVIGIRGQGARHQDLQLNRREWERIVPAAAEKAARSGIKTTYPKVFLSRQEPFECAGSVAENYFIFPNKRVYRCPLCEDYPIHSMMFQNDQLVGTSPINEADLFQLHIPEGCVMNKIIQPDNLKYQDDGTPEYKVACCLLKEEI